ncbi:MAG: protein-L-isoaspartate O-methyltransferase [Desulfobacca sp.]|nr:protein-L-isoaspartate O-methyltransferase [Desulfobacca sp.]
MKKSIVFLWGFLITFSFLIDCTAGKEGSETDRDTQMKTRREGMVATQIKARGINDSRVLKAMFKVERHRFVPENLQSRAYNDHPLPIGKNQTISQPYIVALMTELLQLKGDEKVLEIGTGSGYQAAVLGELAKEVYTIEIIESLARSAKDRLQELGYTNIKVKAGDGYQGWPEAAPFDAVLVTAAPDHIPEPLFKQLKEGGRMILPVGTYPYQELKKIIKKSGRPEISDLLPVLFVPMTGEGVKQKR